VKISSSRLTTCRVTADGEAVELGLVDHSDTEVSLELPFEQAEAVVMTLPLLLTHALKRRTGKPEARYVFSLGDWLIEDTRGENYLIVTLKTTDGFEVSFAIPFEACQALGWSLKHEVDGAREADIDADETGDRAGDAPPSSRSGLN
jgi:hypothetical protein